MSSYILPIIYKYDKSNPNSREAAIIGGFHHFLNITNSLQNNGNLRNLWSTFPTWQSSAQHRKVVRRSKPSGFAKLSEEPDAIVSTISYDGETIEMLSLPPHLIDIVDPRIRRLQVQGLQLPTTTNLPELCEIDASKESLIVELQDLTISTGKMIAQSAHAAQYVAEIFANVSETVPDTIVFSSASTQPHSIANTQHSPVMNIANVVDAGLTEISEGNHNHPWFSRAINYDTNL